MPGSESPAPWQGWRHLTKLDPDRALPARALDLVLASGTDAIIVGGTQGITPEKVLGLAQRVTGRGLPVMLEVSSAAAALPGAEIYLIPMVLNAPATAWMVGNQAVTLAKLLPEYGPWIPWAAMWPACYLILNPDSAAGQLTQAQPLDAPAAAGYAALAGRLLRQPLLYLEYSGRYGDAAVVAAACTAAGPDCCVWYGGGIRDAATACEMATLADAVVVGNIVYEQPEMLAAIVAAVRGATGRASNQLPRPCR